MSWVFRLLKSSIGCKVIMALTGVALFLFVVAHLSGNLLVFAGADAMNRYAQGLRDLGPLLWVARISLLGVVLIHIFAALRLTQINRDARPVAYVRNEPVASTAASRSMMFTGLTVAAYTLFHLAHLTWGIVLHDYYDQVDAEGRHHVYAMVVQGFQVWWITVLYVVAMIILALHLRHGMTSFFQSLGLNHTRYNALFHKFGPAVALLIAAGYIAIPVAILLGFVTLEGGAS